MEAGDKVKVVANVYMDGLQSDHTDKVGEVVRAYEEGYYVKFPKGGDFFFEARELELVQSVRVGQAIEELQKAVKDLEVALSEMESSTRPVSPTEFVSGALGAVVTALEFLLGK